MPDGLKIKYDVTKVEDGTVVYNCFVLRPDRDIAARAALLAYADATSNRELAKDILKWLLELSLTMERPYQ